MSDLEIIDSIKNGNKESYRLLVDKYKPVVIGTIYNMIGFVPESEDVAQDVFIRFYKNIDNFRGDSSLKTYLTRIAINLSLNELKRRNTRYYDSIDDVDVKELGVDNDQGKDLEYKDLLNKALMTLDADFRSVINLRLIQEFSTRETADILKIPEGTVLSRLSRAQLKLKDAIDAIAGERHGQY